MACAEWSVIEKILPYLDTYLMDIKHTDPEKHRRFTGKSNELMLENAKKVAASGLTELIVRVPVVPTFNCTQPEIESIARFAASLPGVKKMHLLPYHRLGQDKYDGLGRKYELADILPPTTKQWIGSPQPPAAFQGWTYRSAGKRRRRKTGHCPTEKSLWI